MKGITFITIAIVLTMSMGALFAGDRALVSDDRTTFGSAALRFGNCGMVGGDDADGPALEWPYGSRINYLYQGALWFGGTVHRRNADGVHLFWRHWPPEDEMDLVTEEDSCWNPELHPAIDTLTSVGFDGDRDIMEMLPAYNPVEESALGELFTQYNADDHTTMNYFNILGYDDDGDGAIDEDPPGRIMGWDNLNDNYCFNLPYDDDGDGEIDEDGGYAGMETGLGFYYDISPFGTDVERHWGSTTGSSNHFPLGIAVEQRTYAWNVRSLADAVILHFRITNIGGETINDYALSYYFDADVGPIEWGSEAVYDDVSSYNLDYDFPYSYDADHDNGITPGYVAVKALGESSASTVCFTWNRGDGPDDRNPRDLTPTGSLTSNEKYWLQTGRNPETDNYTSLVENPNFQLDDPRETRFLYGVYGDDFDLEPYEIRDFYVAIFLANSEFGLINAVENLQAFYESGFDLSIFDGDPSVPAILNARAQEDGQSIRVNWFTATLPDSLYLCYKQAEEPATEWQNLILDPGTDSYLIEGLAEETDYNVKVAVVYDDVYLHSPIVTLNTNDFYNADQNTAPPVEAGEISVYPNPFNPSTTIALSLPESGEVKLDVYNIRGEKVRSLLSEYRDAGRHLIRWNCCNDNGDTVASGIYFARLKSDGRSLTCKMLLLK